MTIFPDNLVQAILDEVTNLETITHYGRVLSVKGNLIECSGLEKYVHIGARCKVMSNKRHIITEVVGFRQKITLLIAFTGTDGISPTAKVVYLGSNNNISPDITWLGRVINAATEPIDGKGPLQVGNVAYNVKNTPPPAHQRVRIGKKIDLGVRAVNNLLTCCLGQRMGIFAGSGVGKSVLISMLTRHVQADVKIVGLVGERGREVQEFIQEYLGEDGLHNTIVVVATGDESALMRRQAAYVTLTLAEYFRDLGKEVLCIIDSMTRFAMAQREIGLMVGEPPTTRGYTPSVFSELPKLLERAGPGTRGTHITAFFNVLVEGDDHNEPITDAVRGILDGHIVLDRAMAERSRFPSINVTRSISRSMPACNSKEENDIVQRVRSLISLYDDMVDMIKIGAYQVGSNQEVDKAIRFFPKIEAFLSQTPDEITSMADGYVMLGKILAEVDQ